MGKIIEDTEKQYIKSSVEFWNGHPEIVDEVNIDKKDIFRLNEYEKGNLNLRMLTFDQRTRLQRAYIIGQQFCSNENLFKTKKTHNENEDYCSFCCNIAPLCLLDKITDKKGTVFFCPNCKRLMSLTNLWFFEEDDNLECMITNKRGAVSISTEWLTKPLNASPDITKRLLMGDLSKSELKKIYEIYGDNDQTRVFIHI